MYPFTPPGLYDVSIALLQAIADTYERHEGKIIPVIAYRRETFEQDSKKRVSEKTGPFIELAVYPPGDVPPPLRRWYRDCPFVVAIPEAVWRICPARLVDYDEGGTSIVLKERWDGQAIPLPRIML